MPKQANIEVFVIDEQGRSILCDKHRIEDEFHFVLSSPLYNQICSVFCHILA